MGRESDPAVEAQRETAWFTIPAARLPSRRSTPAEYKSGMKQRGTNELFESFVKANLFLPRQRRLNPSFCRHEVQHKADPKSRAEEFITALSLKNAGGKKHCNDGRMVARQANRKGANHPLRCSDFTPAGYAKRFAQRE